MTGQTRRKFLWTLAGSIPAVALLTKWFYKRDDFNVLSLASLDSHEVFDVCIAGSGPAGAVLACELVRRGIRTVILEAGEIRDENFFARDDSFDGSLSGLSQEFLYPIDSTRYIGIGGTSNLWGGFCPRFRRVDFLANSYSPGGKPWPVSYGDLEPYFTKAERELHVHWSGDGIAAFGEFLAKAGYVIEKTPLSEWEGEPIRIAKSHLPGFTRSRVGKLINNARVTKIVSGKNGAITSFHVFGFDGVRKEIQARFYVLACGGIETPRILLLSRSREYPNGIGNEYDHVGRYFMEHMQVAGEGRVDLQARPYHGPYVEAISWQFHEDFKSRGHGGVVVEFQSPREDTPTMGISPIMEMEPSGRNRVALDEKLKDSFDNPKAKVVLKLSEKDIKTIETAQSLMRQIFSSLGIKSVEISQKVDWLHHHMGTCRMASDPREGVVDANLKVHGTENLYVAGSASFVTSSAAPPTLSIVALSLRLADHLIRKLQNRKSTGGLVSAAGKGFASDRRNGSMHRQSNRDHT